MTDEVFEAKAKAAYQALLVHNGMVKDEAGSLAESMAKNISDISKDPEIAGRIKYAMDHPTKEEIKRSKAIARRLKRIQHLF